MLERLKEIFVGQGLAQEYQAIKERLGKNAARACRDQNGQDALPGIQRGFSQDRAIPVMQLMRYWQEPAEGTLLAQTNRHDPHVAQSLNRSETMLQPGSAECFAPFREHPIDEITARRQRTTLNHLPVKLFLRKPNKVQKIA